MSENKDQDQFWTNTQGTPLDWRHSNKLFRYKGIYYIAQCLSYREEIRLRSGDHVYQEVLNRINSDELFIHNMRRDLQDLMYCRNLQTVPNTKPNETDPYWGNGFFSQADARAAYAIACFFHPKTIIEVGSGNSTKFFRKAIRDSSAKTKLVSIDPSPRTEISSIVDQVLPNSVVDVNLAEFDALESGDVLFWDGSHICFDGSDVCTLFIDVLPRLKPGVIVHIHDISLPYAGFLMFPDVPKELNTQSPSEQLMLATMLLNSKSTKIVLPIFHLWREKQLADYGSSFWFITG